MADFVVPQTRYARSDDINIAYQSVGDGPIDLMIVPGSISHVEMVHELPAVSGNMQRLARFARVISIRALNAPGLQLIRSNLPRIANSS